MMAILNEAKWFIFKAKDTGDLRAGTYILLSRKDLLYRIQSDKTLFTQIFSCLILIKDYKLKAFRLIMSCVMV